MAKYTRLRGTADFIPPYSELLRSVEEEIVDIVRTFGFKEIITPILERRELFTRSIGETTDIVEKEMFSFKDKGGREVVLRPEGTAPVVRAYVEEGVYAKERLTRYFYRGSFFRYEKPQAGREREFHQIGVEALGSKNPYLDAEIIYLGDQIIRRLNITNFILELGSVGCLKDREKFVERLRKTLRNEISSLCEDCKRRIEQNPLRVFDCKVEGCKEVSKRLPSILDTLCDNCKSHLQKVEKILEELKVPYHLHPHLVRGLDYYTGITFEFQHTLMGAQNTLLAGGRYDNLVEEIGGPHTPACGFALGLERILIALQKERKEKKGKSGIKVFICYVSENEFLPAFHLTQDLRKEGITSDLDYSGKNLKHQLKLANRLKAEYSIILGEDEVKEGKLLLKNMDSGEQKLLSKKETIKILKQ
ncbi:histidine--tRNA ligase [Candidatus Calescamantes bacterium]|nr:histidine--tRNA ligase [Candidatus Calescamantes bacterium]